MDSDIKELFYPMEWTARFIIIGLLSIIMNEPGIFYLAVAGAGISLIWGLYGIFSYCMRKNET